MSAPEKDPPPATVELKPALVEDQDEIYQPMLGPTLAQLQEKAAKGTLTGGDIAGYLALVQGFSETYNRVPVEYLGARPQQIASEVFSLIAEKLVGLAAWSKVENDSRKKAARERNEKLQDMANEHYLPEAKATDIAEDFLAKADSDPALHDLLQVWKPEQNAYGHMTEDALRKIIGKRDERRK